MASQEIPKPYEPLIELMEDAADGAATHGVAVGLKQNTEAAIRADLVALTGKPAGPGGVPPAQPGLKALLNAAKTDKSAKTAALRTACSNGRALAMACIGTLKPVLGTTWNSAWNAAGFTDGSIAVPANPMVKLQQSAPITSPIPPAKWPTSTASPAPPPAVKPPPKPSAPRNPPATRATPTRATRRPASKPAWPQVAAA